MNQRSHCSRGLGGQVAVTGELFEIVAEGKGHAGGDPGCFSQEGGQKGSVNLFLLYNIREVMERIILPFRYWVKTRL